MTENEISELIGHLVPELIKQKKVIASAESCTGGWISKSLTDFDGSSQWFDCSIVTYSNQAKRELLGVQQHTLDAYGAVSQPVVKEMVLGLLDRCGANMGISISGIAGPGGGTEDKPVGTVWIAWAKSGVFIEAVKFQFEGNRDEVRLNGVYQAIKGVERLLAQ
jgi:nicotinamide-nucleotide amidase